MRKTRQMLALEDEFGDPIEQLITSALERNNGNITAAAQSLGVNAKTFWGWMLRCQIAVTKRVSSPAPWGWA